ncbi:MAG: YfcE family phosphodiesterase [Treponema sp.]|nr:YfcE family phosphodiesterase [Treponema sp.]
MSKKLLVFSDTHGSVTALKAVFNWAKDFTPPNDTICTAVCLGDGISDIGTAANAAGFYSDWRIVGGNNDYGITAPETLVFDINEHRFFICHGHRHGLYNGFNTLLGAAKHSQADTVLFGHIHTPFFKVIDGISIICPGSVGRSRSRIGETFAVIECTENESLNVDFYKLDYKNTIKKIKI